MKRLWKFTIALLFISLFICTVQGVAPSVTVDNPTGGTVEGIITLKATAIDSDGNITKVEFYHNKNGAGWEWIGENTSSPTDSYTLQWDTTGVANGNSYEIKVNATDNSSEIGNATSPVFSISNVPPTVTVDYPNGGETLSDNVTISASANDDGNISVVKFYNSSDNGSSWTLIGSVFSSPYDLVWDTTTSPNGTLNLIKAEATDNIGLKSNDTSNSTFSILNIPNILPNISVIWPDGGETISNGTITITASASDPDGSIDNVQFYWTINNGSSKSPIGDPIGTPTTSGLYETSWNTLDVSNGANYKIIAEATDNRSGKASDMSNNTFTIANNHSPTLKNDQSNDSSGISPHTFRFTVNYTDSDNDTGTVEINLDGTWYPMTAADSNNPIAGITYEYITTLTTAKEYTFYFRADDGKNPAVTTNQKKVTVNPKTYYTGDRIWEGQSTTYTWTPQSFGGFYYNLDTDEGKETLKITGIGSTIDDKDIEYKTEPIEVDFERSSFGTYYVIGFMAERYFAGYKSGPIGDTDDSLLDEELLSKVLIDDDDSQMIRAGTPLELAEGYDFRVTEFGATGDDVMVGLFKDGERVHETIVSEGDTYIYKKDLGRVDNFPIIAIHIKTVFRGMETSSVSIDGIFQISDEVTEVERGLEFGLMEVDSVNVNQIIMHNPDSVSLKKGRTFNLMGKINIQVGDSDTLRFAPVLDISEPGTYELRGTVTEENTQEWTPLNFEGLLYDMDSGDGKETLKLTRSGRSVGKNDLVYTTKPISMGFEHGGWGTYDSIGFMGEKYFAGYPSGAIVSGGASLLEQERLGTILMDENDKHTLHVGNSLTLQEGYSLRIDEISRSGNAIMITLLKDGEEIRTDITNEGTTYTYDVEIDKEDIPIIAVHIDKVFRGMETNSVFIKGIFQISEDFKAVQVDDTYGKMTVTSVTDSKITMKNDDSFSLSKGSTVPVMGNINFKVADSSTVRFYPYEEIVVEEPLYLELDIPATAYQNEDLTITVTSDGDEVQGATITLDDAEIGTTDSNGELIYTPTDAGTYTITASKSGYESDSEDIDILYQPKVLEITAPLVEDRGETIVISVTSEGKGVSGAAVKFGSKDLGTTPSSGNITYTPDEIGSFTITASKTGYQDASESIDITDPGAKLVFSNLTVKPRVVQPGENVNITVEASNFGTLRESQTAFFKINGQDVAKVDLVMEPGEITTLMFSVNRTKPGTYLVEVDGRSSTFKVAGNEMSATTVIVLGIIVILSATAAVYSVVQGTLTFGTVTAKAQALERMLRRLVEK